MRWIGLSLAFIAASYLAWDVFASPRLRIDQPAIVDILGQKRMRIVSAIGITTGLLLIVMSPRKLLSPEGTSRWQPW